MVLREEKKYFNPTQSGEAYNSGLDKDLLYIYGLGFELKVMTIEAHYSIMNFTVGRELNKIGFLRAGWKL